ncbi:MAG: M12 family metallo-peptidase [Planctomycetota bacterium]|nr:M12 family metallo-peptidase [Planctomycetota bacterium]
MLHAVTIAIILATSGLPDHPPANDGTHEGWVVEIDHRSDRRPRGAEVLHLSGEWGEFVVELKPTTLRHPDFRLINHSGSCFTQIEAPRSRHYRGTVRGHERSRVVLQSSHQGWRGMLLMDDDPKAYLLSPPGPDSDRHRLTRARDAEDRQLCGVDDAAIPTFDSNAPLPRAAQGGRTLELTIDVDRAYLDLLGGSHDAVLLDVEAVLNGVAEIYANDFDLEVVLRTVIIREDPETYPSNNTIDLMCDLLRNWNIWNNSDFETDLTQLFTGKPVNGVVGYAYPGTACSEPVIACSQFGVKTNKSVVASRYTTDFAQRVALSAHEIGHNLNAFHCGGSGCTIMCPVIGNCAPIESGTLEFGSSSRITIGAYIANQPESCLSSSLPAVSPPLVSDFELQIEPEVWEFTTQAAYSNAGYPPHSGTWCCALSKDFAQYDYTSSIMTRKINLAARLNGTISFWLKRRYSVGAGFPNTIALHGLSSEGNWLEIDSFGAQLNSWTNYTAQIPSELMWEGARFRFQSRLNADRNELWLIDLVEIDASDPINIDNDECAGAEEVLEGWNPFTTAGATDSVVPMEEDCMNDGQALRSDVWFSWTAPCTGTTAMTTCTMIDFAGSTVAYDLGSAADCESGPLNPVACEVSGSCPGPFGETIEFPCAAGSQYLIRVGSRDGSQGSGGLYVLCTPEEPNPCPADFNFDEIVNGIDLGVLLGAWGSSERDLTGDETVDGADIAVLLGQWGFCGTP